jgi:hypothetical protein
MGKGLSDFLPEMRFGRPAELKVHLVSEDELTRLEQGDGQSVFLECSIALISIATSFLIAIITTKIDSVRTYTVFIVISVVGFISGIVLLLLWGSVRKPIRKLVKEIRSRMPPEGESLSTPVPPAES